MATITKLLRSTVRQHEIFGTARHFVLLAPTKKALQVYAPVLAPFDEFKNVHPKGTKAPNGAVFNSWTLPNRPLLIRLFQEAYRLQGVHKKPGRGQRRRDFIAYFDAEEGRKKRRGLNIRYYRQDKTTGGLVPLKKSMTKGQNEKPKKNCPRYASGKATSDGVMRG